MWSGPSGVDLQVRLGSSSGESHANHTNTREHKLRLQMVSRHEHEEPPSTGMLSVDGLIPCTCEAAGQRSGVKGQGQSPTTVNKVFPEMDGSGFCPSSARLMSMFVRRHTVSPPLAPPPPLLLHFSYRVRSTVHAAAPPVTANTPPESAADSSP